MMVMFLVWLLALNLIRLKSLPSVLWQLSGDKVECGCSEDSKESKNNGASLLPQ